MNSRELLKIVRVRHHERIQTLEKKGSIYSKPTDRLENFRDSALLNNQRPQQALWGMVTKHIIAVKKAVQSGEVPSHKWRAEYLGDIHNFLDLLEAIWVEEEQEITAKKGDKDVN